MFVGLIGSAQNLLTAGVASAVGYTRGRTPSDIEGLSASLVLDPSTGPKPKRERRVAAQQVRKPPTDVSEEPVLPLLYGLRLTVESSVVGVLVLDRGGHRE